MENNNITVNVVKKSNGMGVAGFVLALIALVFCWVPFLNGIMWLLGLIFSIIGMFKRPKGLAIAGLVISCFWIIVVLVFVGAAVASGM